MSLQTSTLCYNAYFCYRRLSTLLAKPCRLEHTPYLSVCCRHLLQDLEIPTDSLLVQLVRIRQIAIKVHDAFWQKSDLSNERPFRAVHTIAIASIEKELDAFMDNLPEPLKSNRRLAPI